MEQVKIKKGTKIAINGQPFTVEKEVTVEGNKRTATYPPNRF